MNKWMLIFLFAANWVNGQDVTLNINATDPLKLSLGFNLFIPPNDHQYLASQWTKGKLFYANGTSKTYDSLNFDRYSDAIEVVINNKPLSIMPMGLSGALIYSSNNSGTVLIVGKVDGKRKFLLVLSEGQHLLASFLHSSEHHTELTYKIDEIIFVPQKEEEPIIKKNYVVLDNRNWIRFKMNKSAISKLFNVDKKELKSIASNKGINTSDKRGLLQLFQALNKYEY